MDKLTKHTFGAVNSQKHKQLHNHLHKHPQALMECLAKKLRNLEEHQIIEKVEHPKFFASI